MVELEDVGADIDPAADDLIFRLLFDISAVKIGDCTGRDLGYQGVIVDVTGIVSAAAVAASPENIHFSIANGEGRALLEINDLSSRIIGSFNNVVIPVEKALAVTAGLGAFFEISGVGQIDLAHIKSVVVKNRRDLIHVIIMIVGKVDIKGIEVMVIQIIYQSVIRILDIGVHQKILSAAGDHS